MGEVRALLHTHTYAPMRAYIIYAKKALRSFPSFEATLSIHLINTYRRGGVRPPENSLLSVFGQVSPHSRQAKDNIVKSSRQPPPFEGGFKGDVLFGTVAFCSKIHHHSQKNIPLAPFKRGRLRDVLTI